PFVGGRVVEPDGGALQLDAPAPLVAVAKRAAGEVDEAAIGDVVAVGAVDAADAGGRGLRETLLPGLRVEVVGEEMEPLRDAVVAAEVDPFHRDRVIGAAPLPAEHRSGLLLRRALLDPGIDRMRGEVLGERSDGEKRETQKRKKARTHRDLGEWMEAGRNT